MTDPGVPPFLIPWVPGWVPPPPAPTDSAGTSAVTFPATPMRFLVEVALGVDPSGNPDSWVFTDITARVRAVEGVNITKGRGSEGSQASPTTCAFTVDNTNGDFSPYNPLGRWWPNMRRGIPVRVSVDPGSGLVERFSGFIASLTPGWDVSGNMPTAAVEASGLLQRLGQGTPPSWSPLRRTILSRETRSKLVAYWPCEDGADSTTAASAIPGQDPLAALGTVTFSNVTPGASIGETVRFGTKNLPDLVAGGGLSALIVGANASAWTVSIGIEFFLTLPASNATIATWDTPGGTFVRWSVAILTTGEIRVTATDSAGSSTTLFTQVILNTGFGEYRVDAVQRGSSVDVRLRLVYGSVAASTVVTSNTLGAPTVISINPSLFVGSGLVTVFGAGHIQVWSTHEAPYLSLPSTEEWAVDAWNSFYVDALGTVGGERAADRLVRLCAEDGVRISVDADFATSIQMGRQPDGALLDLLRECETADGGILHDGASDFRLAYRSRESMYNQAAALSVDMASGQVAPPFQPVDDDQRIRNEWTASRSGTTEATYVNVSHQAEHGVWPDSVTVNVADDAVLLPLAQWLVNLGTYGGGYRYPNLNLNFAGSPGLIDDWLTVGIGDRLTVSVSAAEHPPGQVDLLVEGWSEYLNLFEWTVTANCSPYQLWEVFEIEGSGNRGRLDTGGSSLAVPIDSDDTVLSVATSLLPLWTTTATFPADFPFDLDVDGEQVTVTAVSGTSSPQTFTVVRSVNGVSKSYAAGTAVSLWRPGVIAR